MIKSLHAFTFPPLAPRVREQSSGCPTVVRPHPVAGIPDTGGARTTSWSLGPHGLLDSTRVVGGAHGVHSTRYLKMYLKSNLICRYSDSASRWIGFMKWELSEAYRITNADESRKLSSRVKCERGKGMGVARNCWGTAGFKCVAFFAPFTLKISPISVLRGFS